MKKLIRLIQEDGCEGVYLDRKTPQMRALHIRALPSGKIRTLVFQNPCLDLDSEVQRRAEENPLFVPPNANCYVISEFNPDTQHLRENKAYSVCAVQFYSALCYSAFESELNRM